MSNSVAFLHGSILKDEDYLALPPTAKLAYVTLLLQPSLSLCGAIHYKPKRWAEQMGVGVPSLKEALETLVRDNFLVADEDTDEVLVRSYVRNSGKLKTAPLIVGVSRAYGEIESERLRSVVLENIPLDLDLVAFAERVQEVRGQAPRKLELIEPFRSHYLRARSLGIGYSKGEVQHCDLPPFAQGMAYPAQYGAPNGVRNPVVNRDNLTTATTAKPDKNARGANAGVGGSGTPTASGPHAEGDDYEPPADDDWVPPYEEPLAFSADDLALVDEPEGGFEGVDPETGRPSLRVLTGSGGEADPSTDTGLERPLANPTAVAVVDAPKKRSKSAEANVAPEDVQKVWDAYVAAIRTPAGLWKPRPRSGDRIAFTPKHDSVIRKAIVGFGLDAVLHAVSAWRWDGWCAGVTNGETHYSLDRLLAVDRHSGNRIWVLHLQGIETDGSGSKSAVSDMLDRFMENNGFVDGVGFVGSASIGSGS